MRGNEEKEVGTENRRKEIILKEKGGEEFYLAFYDLINLHILLL
jgi:hypothetical protein